MTKIRRTSNSGLRGTDSTKLEAEMAALRAARQEEAKRRSAEDRAILRAGIAQRRAERKALLKRPIETALSKDLIARFDSNGRLKKPPVD